MSCDLKSCKHSRHVKVVVMTGSLPQGVPASIYADLITMLKPLHVPVFLDTSGDALIHGVGAIPFFIKPNEEEAEALLDTTITKEIECVRGIQKLMEQGISYIVISMGKDGSYVGYQNNVYRSKASEIQVANTVGSGGAFVAGMAVGVSRGIRLKTAFGSRLRPRRPMP